MKGKIRIIFLNTIIEYVASDKNLFSGIKKIIIIVRLLISILLPHKKRLYL